MNAHAGYDVTLKEIHHTQKKDAPSGTAVTLAEGVLANLSRKKNWVNKQTSTPEELSIISERIDPAPGTHYVKYSSEVDDIEIIHTAHNRKGFALGAVLAAEYIEGKKGVFDMKDVLNADFMATHGKPDVVITDPPRAGMHADVVQRLLEMEAPKIVYVSCNAATQARDIALLKEKVKNPLNLTIVENGANNTSSYVNQINTPVS